MKILLIILAIVSVGAAIAMYVIGNNSSNSSELKDLFYIPLPLGAVALMGALRLPGKSNIPDD